MIDIPRLSLLITTNKERYRHTNVLYYSSEYHTKAKPLLIALITLLGRVGVRDLTREGGGEGFNQGWLQLTSR